ncbi:MAG: MMPL family transporter [Euryarchaeota archaeon]|jgi:predicted RND superfamily exporter protein|nr:MMPL family transporter [Euryarchaeota archaeon]
MVGDSKSEPPSADKRKFSKRVAALAEYSRSKIQSGAVDLTARVKDFNAKSAIDAVLDAPDRFKREWQKSGATGAITRFPIATVLIFLMITGYFVTTSGFLDGTRFDDDINEPALNVNGDLEVYLPEGSEVGRLIGLVEEDWTTNVMIIYIESGDGNITDKRILEQISLVENVLNPCLSSFTCDLDGDGVNETEDDVIYILSLSTVLKEVNSSAPRVREAIVTELGQLGCAAGEEECTSATAADTLNQLFESTDEQFGGSYEIPSQNTIDLVVGEMYEDDGTSTPGLDKLARDVCTTGYGDVRADSYKNECGSPDYILDKAIMAVALSDEIDAKTFIAETQAMLEEMEEREIFCDDENGDGIADSKPCNWKDENEGLNLQMVLTGPVPITNAVTEFSFKLFWEIFPLAIVLVAGGLFVFHSDILQTGITGIRPIQGMKVVIIAGLPTLCAVFWTLGLIGATNYEVTMTVIIVGPILLALGVSYGLHITNRYAEEGGTKSEKMKASLSSTGKAVFLSAVTTVIGFISLVFTPMAPIQTVGIALSTGIVIVYILTMFMVPNLTLILDLRKPKHPPLKAFEHLVNVPVKHNKAVIGVFVLVILISATVGQANVEENIDLLGMAPEYEPSVQKMKQYSSDFDAGQIGMVLIHAKVTGDTNDQDTGNDDPAENLKRIDQLEAKLNTVNNASAVSIVFLMKSTGIAPTVSGTQLYQFINNTPLPDDIKETASLLLNREVTADASFWDLLTQPDNYGLPGTTQSQIFLLDVFYASITDETREIFINSEFDRTLIYVDMPFIPVAETASGVEAINQHTDTFTSVDGGGAEHLTGVAATAIEVNELIVGSQWTSLGFAIILTLITLAVVFRDIQYSFWTTAPVIATVALQWLVMWQLDVSLSLVTVMIGSILVGVGVDFSIHISNRIRELGGGINAIKSAAIGTGMSLFEAAIVTSLGMLTAYKIPIPEIKPFITVILILLWVAAASALILLPAIFVTLEKMGIGSVQGTTGMARKLGLIKTNRKEVDVLDAAIVKDVKDVW